MQPRFVILGDSVSAGFGLAVGGEGLPGECYARRLQQLASDCGLQLIVSALDGTDTTYALRRFHRMVTAHEPRWVMVMLGLNDARPAGAHPNIPPEDFAQNILALVDRVAAIEARAILVTPNPRFDATHGIAEPADCMQPYVEALRGIARALNLPLIDVHARFVAAENLRALVPDGVHPSAAGHRLIAEVLSEQLPPVVLTPQLQASRTTAP